MAITYNNSVPAAPNDPSDDQPLMLQNTQAIKNIWGVDHYDFDSASPAAGTHQWVRMQSFTAPGAQAAGAGTAHTAAGVADVNAALMYFKNNNATFPMNLCRAFIVFSIASAGPPSTVTPLNSYNCSVVGTTSTRAKVTITAGTVTGNNVGILVFNNIALGNPSYTFVNPDLTFTSNLVASTPAIYTVLFLQA